MRGPGRIRPLAAAAVLAAASLWGTFCGRPSDESAIRALLKESVARAEKRDIDGLMALFAPDYMDFAGRDPAATRSLVAGYLDQYRAVVIHLLGARIGETGPDGRAVVEFEVSLSHGAAQVLRKLIRLAGEYYRFRMEVQKTGRGEWRYVSAEWRPMGLADLFPESLDLLKELFPGF